MADTDREPGADRFDFYGAHYRRFGGGLATDLRREVYGDGDVGQTGWRTGEEQAEIPGLLRLGPVAHVLDVACGAGGPSLDLAERTGCRLTGLDIEPAGVARAGAEAAAGRLPFADGAFDAVLCVDALVHLPDRLAALREWARLLRPGGRLLFADAAVLTGPVAKGELDARAANGAFLLVPPGCNEAALAAAGLALLRREDRTEAVAGIAGRWHAARARHGAALERKEGAAWFKQRQRFLEVTARLAANRQLSRFLYLAEKAAGVAPGSVPAA